MSKVINDSLDRQIEMGHQPFDCLAENLSQLLLAHHISVGDLAKILNIPYNTINRIMNGVTSDPRISTLQQIADHFCVSLDVLIHGKDNLTSPDPMLIPIFRWDELHSDDFLINGHNDNQRKYINASSLENEIINKNFFAIESTKSMQKRFPIGTTFIVKKNENPIDGDLAIIRFKEDNTISLREMIIDSPKWQMVPIISGSSSITFEHKEHEIIGIIFLTLIHTRSN